MLAETQHPQRDRAQQQLPPRAADLLAPPSIALPEAPSWKLENVILLPVRLGRMSIPTRWCCQTHDELTDCSGLQPQGIAREVSISSTDPHKSHKPTVFVSNVLESR